MHIIHMVLPIILAKSFHARGKWYKMLSFVHILSISKMVERIRLERQEYPSTTLADAIEEKLNSSERIDDK
jgi:hypothetical protein